MYWFQFKELGVSDTLYDSSRIVLRLSMGIFLFSMGFWAGGYTFSWWSSFLCVRSFLTSALSYLASARSSSASARSSSASARSSLVSARSYLASARSSLASAWSSLTSAWSSPLKTKNVQGTNP